MNQNFLGQKDESSRLDANIGHIPGFLYESSIKFPDRSDSAFGSVRANKTVRARPMVKRQILTCHKNSDFVLISTRAENEFEANLIFESIPILSSDSDDMRKSQNYCDICGLFKFKELSERNTLLYFYSVYHIAIQHQNLFSIMSFWENFDFIYTLL